MSQGNHKHNSFSKFVGQTQAFVLGLLGFIVTVVSFIKLVQEDTGLVTLILLLVGVLLLWLACLYFVRFWRPEQLDGQTGLILPALTDNKQVLRQKKKEQQRRAIRRIALAGLVSVPLIAVSGYGAWSYIQGLPSDEVIILVADFDGTGEESRDFTSKLLGRIEAAIDDDDDVRIVALQQTVTTQMGSDEARKLAQKNKAAVMVWGEYWKRAEAVRTKTNIELSEDYFSGVPESMLYRDVTYESTFGISDSENYATDNELASEAQYITFLALGLADFAAENWDSAIKRFNTAVSQIDTEDVTVDLSYAHFYQGVSFALKEEYQLAIEAFDKVIATEPNIENSYLEASYYNKGAALTRLGRSDEALDAYDEALKINPDAPDRNRARGITLISLGQYEEAIGAYDKALESNPNDVEALLGKSRALALLSRNEEAISVHDEALEIEPNNAEILLMKGFSTTVLGRLEEALSIYDKALEIEPNYIEAFNAKGIALGGLERYSEAIDAYDKALEVDPNYASSLYGKAAIYGVEGDSDNALEYLGKAITIDENYRSGAKTDPRFDRIRQDTRFQNLVGRDSETS